MAKPRAVVLLSGGLDSATAAAVAKSDGFELYALTVSYGQRHKAELDAAKRVSSMLGVESHVITPIDLRAFGGSALTSETPVPKGRSLEEMSGGIPITYVPARNTVFLSLALAWAEVLEANDIYVGVNAVDYSGYPDCRPEFIQAFETLANLATKSGVEGKQKFNIHTPLINLSKIDIIQIGLSLKVDYSKTVTCYDPSENGEACGQCDSCLIRLKGFADLGIKDATPYR